jgi:transcriptional regulator with XRE-family HTH domain
MVAYHETEVKTLVGPNGDDGSRAAWYVGGMSNHADDGSKRRHFIAEWAELRGKRQTDIVRDLGIEKSTVYRWFAEGVIPSEKHLVPLAAYLAVEEPVLLFKHPDDDWLAKMFRDKTDEQREKAVAMLKLFFESISPSDDGKSGSDKAKHGR